MKLYKLKNHSYFLYSCVRSKKSGTILRMMTDGSTSIGEIIFLLNEENIKDVMGDLYLKIYIPRLGKISYINTCIEYINRYENKISEN